MNSIKSSQMQKGFTIVELLIATMVFSVVLLVLTAGIIQIGRVYYKGITESQTQAATRAIVNAVKQDLQFSSGAVVPGISSGGMKANCIGNRVYQYTNALYTGTSTGIVSGTLSAGSCAPGMSLPASLTRPQELLGNRMRVINFSVTTVSADFYTVVVRVASGENDLLCSPSRSDCSTPTDTFSGYAASGVPTDTTCKNIRTGSQYCSVSEISTLVERRVSN